MGQMLAGLFCAVLGAALVLIAAFSWLRTRRFVAGAVPAFGEVVGLREHHGEGVTYSPVVRFSAPGGRAVEFTEPASTGPAGYCVGQRVRILYDPADPSRARLASPFRLYLLAMISGGLGVIFFAVGLLATAFAV